MEKDKDLHPASRIPHPVSRQTNYLAGEGLLWLFQIPIP